jgi:hypothetical protein
MMLLFCLGVALLCFYVAFFVICGVGFNELGPHFDYCPYIDDHPRRYHYHQLDPKADWTLQHRYLDSWTDLQNVEVSYYALDANAEERELYDAPLAPNAFTKDLKGKLLARISIRNGTHYVLSRRPLLAAHWANLTRTEQSQFLRYVNVEAEGGIYTDPHVRLRVPVAEWLETFRFDDNGEADEKGKDVKGSSHSITARKRFDLATAQDARFADADEIENSNAKVNARSVGEGGTESPIASVDRKQASGRGENKDVLEKPLETLLTIAPIQQQPTMVPSGQHNALNEPPPTTPTIESPNSVVASDATSHPVAWSLFSDSLQPIDSIGALDFVIGFEQDTTFEYTCPPVHSMR